MAKTKRLTPGEMLVRVKDVVPLIQQIGAEMQRLRERVDALEGKAKEPSA